MPRNHRPGHFVVDGSNIATEGRSVPSLSQLNDAVLAFAADHPDVLLTVVVDATFGHRIDKSEVAEFDEAVANNELVAPPAGAVGRGDAFVLTIADKAGAGVLSNDSFQEFHGQYEWLFDEGRLVGGKPVPYVGWVFVDRTPVRGPKSRQAVKAAKSAGGSKRAAKSASRAPSSQPLATPEEAVAAKEKAKARIRPKAAAASDANASNNVPGAATTPSNGDSSSRPASNSLGLKRGARSKVSQTKSEAASVGTERIPARTVEGGGGYVNELMPFLEFVSNNPVGTVCQGTIDNYASHGAYARVGDVNVYLPLRLMGTPPPRSARSVVNVGDPVSMEIVGFVPARRSVDAALVTASLESSPDDATSEPDSATFETGSAIEVAPQTTTRGRAKSAAKKTPATSPAPPRVHEVATVDPETTQSEPSNGTALPKRAATKKSAPAKPAAKKSAAKKSAAKKSAAKKSAAKETAAKETAAKETAAKEDAPKTLIAKKSTAKKSTARKSAAGKVKVPEPPVSDVAATRSAARGKSAVQPDSSGVGPAGGLTDKPVVRKARAKSASAAALETKGKG